MAGTIDGVDYDVDLDMSRKRGLHADESLYDVLHRIISMILAPDSGGSSPSTPVLQRITTVLTENTPLLKEASGKSGRKVLQWTRRGSPFRALFVISVGTIALLALTGLVVFMLFFLAASVNAVVISLLMSLAAAGAFLAIFFACLVAVYIGALSVAVFVISAITISAIVAVLVTAGWIGFIWTIWLVTKKVAGVGKHSLTMTASAISAYSSARNARRYHELAKVTP